jgi:hypothetical protein
MTRTRRIATVVGVLAALGLATASPALAKAPITTVYPCLVAPCPVATPAP